MLLKNEEEREIRKILRRLSGELGKVCQPLSHAIEAMAQLDFITAKARFSRDYGMSAARLQHRRQALAAASAASGAGYLFRHGRAGSVSDRSAGESPVADAPGSPNAPGSPGTPVADAPGSPSSRQVVPIDVRLGQPFNMLVITGPNTGGKTVTLKTTGLLCLMAQAGMHIPAADGSLVPLLHHIFADIGDEQSLEQSLSTFSSHISQIARILKEADAQSLVLLDELGAGTDPVEGAALGRAILDGLDRIGCRAMVTTHLGDLKTYAFHNDRAENAAVEFDLATLQPTYRLHIGQFGMSNALKIARRLQMPRDLLRRAHHYLKRQQRRAPEMAQLQKKREEAEKAREVALAAQHEAQLQRQEYEQKLADLEREAHEAALLREARLRLQPGDPVQIQKFDKPGRIIRVDLKRHVAVVSVGLGQWEVSLEEIFPQKS